MKGYVTYQDRRYRVVGRMAAHEGLPEYLRLRPFKGPDVMAPATQVKKWHREGGRRLARGAKVNVRLDTHTEIIECWQKGRRRKLTCTFNGLHDILTRQFVINARNKRAKHIGRKP